MNAIGQTDVFLKCFVPFLIWISESLAETQDVSKSSPSHMKAVKDKILKVYDKTIRPATDDSNITWVAVRFEPRQIMEVDEERGLFVLDSILTMVWEDPRLKWNVSSEYDGILQVPADLLWIPDIIVHNSLNTQINPNGEAFPSVLAEGFVTWNTILHTETSCPALAQASSHQVSCKIQMGSRPYSGWDIDVITDKHLFLQKFLNIHSRWELLGSQTKITSNKTIYDGYTHLHSTFPMKRRLPPEIGVVNEICLLIRMLALSIFWLAPNSSKKILLGGFLFMVLIQLLMGIAWITKYPLIALFTESRIRSTMYIVVSTLIIQVLIIFNVGKITGSVRPPNAAVMRLLKGRLGKLAFVRLCVDLNKNIPIDAIQLNDNAVKHNPPSTCSKSDWMLLATGLDRLFFIVMAIVVFSIKL